MQASTWMCTYQMQPIKVHELAPPTCVLLLSKNFDPSQFLNVDPSLSIVHVQIQLLPNAFLHISYLCTNLSPFVINFHKRCASLDTKGGTRDRWLTFESCIFYGHHLYSSLDTTYTIFDLDTNRWGTSPYVIAWVIYLINLISCWWGNLLHLMIT